MNIDLTVFYKLVWGIGLVSAVVAAGITAIFQFLIAWRERVAADKRHLRDLALKATIVQWEHEVARVEKSNRALSNVDSPQEIGEVQFDSILLKKLKVMELFSQRKPSQKTIDASMTEMMNIVRGMKRRNRAAKADTSKKED